MLQEINRLRAANNDKELAVQALQQKLAAAERRAQDAMAATASSSGSATDTELQRGVLAAQLKVEQAVQARLAVEQELREVKQSNNTFKAQVSVRS